MIYVSLFNFLVLGRAALGRSVGVRWSTYWVLLFALFLFSAFRYQVGCDWSGYYYQWMGQSYGGVEGALQQRESLWFLLIELIQRMGLSYPWLNVFSSAIFFGGVHILARRQLDPLGFLVLLFPVLILNLPMSGIRQGAAIGIICMAFVAFIDRKLLRFVVLVSLASLIHSSAAVFLLLIPLVNGRYTRARLALAGLLAIPGAIALASTEGAELALNRYVDSGLDAVGGTFRVGILALSAVFFFLVLRRHWIKEFPEDYKLASIGALAMLGAAALLPVSSVIGDRLGYYLIPIQAMIFGRIPFLHLGQNSKLLSALPYLGLIVVLVVWTSLSWHFQKCYLPYQTWLFGFPNGNNFLAR
jgi:hypothetical protein